MDNEAQGLAEHDAAARIERVREAFADERGASDSTPQLSDNPDETVSPHGWNNTFNQVKPFSNGYWKNK
jgi:hypothetical protein